MTVHLGTILVNNQLDAQLFFLEFFVLFYFLCSIFLYLLQARMELSSIQTYIPDGHLYRMTPDVVLIQMTLLMMST